MAVTEIAFRALLAALVLTYGASQTELEMCLACSCEGTEPFEDRPTECNHAPAIDCIAQNEPNSDCSATEFGSECCVYVARSSCCNYLLTRVPTAEPSPAPTFTPTAQPTSVPSPEPTGVPTQSPTASPTPQSTDAPTPTPTNNPTSMPTDQPTGIPTGVPTPSATNRPTVAPTPESTQQPTVAPTSIPTPPPLNGKVVLPRCTDDGVGAPSGDICLGGSDVAGVSCCRNVSGADTELECMIFEEIEVDFSVEASDLYANGNNIANVDSGNGRHLLQASESTRVLKECIPKDQTYEEATAWCKYFNINNNPQQQNPDAGEWQVCTATEVQQSCCIQEQNRNDDGGEDCVESLKDVPVWTRDSCSR